MPILIRELHIRVAVEAGASQAAGPRATPAQPERGPIDKDAVVAECVEQVMQLLQTRRER